MAKKAAPAPATGMSIDRTKYNYNATRVLDASGKLIKRSGNGDAISIAMMHVTDIGKVAKANKLEVKGVNNGQMRMNLGNQLRGIVRRHAADKANPPAIVGDLTIKSLTQNVPYPASVKAAEKHIATKEKEAGKRAAAKAAEKTSKPKRGAKGSRSTASARATGGSSSTSPATA